MDCLFSGHNERVGAIIFHPRATLDLDTSAPCMVSCASDGSVLLWNLERYDSKPYDDRQIQ